MRAADHYDIEPIMAALLKLQAKAASRGQMKFTDEATARRYITQRVDDVQIIMLEGYAIMYDVGAPWYSKQEFLLEELIIKVTPTDRPVSVAIAALEYMARALHLPAVVAGDTQVGYMRQHYEAAGYGLLGYQFLKEIDAATVHPSAERS